MNRCFYGPRSCDLLARTRGDFVNHGPRECNCFLIAYICHKVIIHKTGFLPLFGLAFCCFFFSQITRMSASIPPIRLHQLPAVRPGAWYTRTILCSPDGIFAPRNAVFARNSSVSFPSTFSTKFSSYGMLVMSYPSLSAETTPVMPSPPYVAVVPPIRGTA